MNIESCRDLEEKKSLRQNSMGTSLVAQLLKDCAIPLQRAWVQFLIRELRSLMLQGKAKNKNKKKKKEEEEKGERNLCVIRTMIGINLSR